MVALERPRRGEGGWGKGPGSSHAGVWIPFGRFIEHDLMTERDVPPHAQPDQPAEYKRPAASFHRIERDVHRTVQRRDSRDTDRDIHRQVMQAPVVNRGILTRAINAMLFPISYYHDYYSSTAIQSCPLRSEFWVWTVRASSGDDRFLTRSVALRTLNERLLK